MRFIQINNRILDFDEYKKEVAALKYLMEYDLKEYFARFGFVLKEKRRCKGLLLVFYNESLDLEIRITFLKSSGLTFV